jgi:hypothetical protein
MILFFKIACKGSKSLVRIVNKYVFLCFFVLPCNMENKLFGLYSQPELWISLLIINKLEDFLSYQQRVFIFIYLNTGFCRIKTR